MSALPIRTLLVDDYEPIRKSLRTLLEDYPEVEVIGEAEDGRKALELMHRLLPNIIIMDVRMPVMNGIEATRWITTVFPDVKVIAFTSCSEKSMVKKMYKAGASGFLLKGCSPVEIISAIKTAAEN
jgi:DNA-binding NarL/FixJ family response regulator